MRQSGSVTPAGVGTREEVSVWKRWSSGSKVQRRAFLLPAVILLLVLSIFPFLATIALSFGTWEMGREGAYGFRGLENFARLISDARYLTSLINTVILVGGSVALQFVLGLALAWMVYQRPPGHRFYRVLFLLPMMLTPVAVAYMWRLIFESRIGALNFFLGAVGIEAVPWLTQRTTALFAVIVVETWIWTPFVFVFLYAALENIERDALDAAIVDGANSWQVFRYVIFPTILPVAVAVLLLRSVEALKIIDTVYVMTGGGPGNSTESVTLYAYRTGLQFFDLGYAAAIAVTLFIGVIAVALPIVIRMSRRAEAG